ncbi:MAG: leucyl/phenylalanyl-tRNA--protein transferase [Haliangiales bacterium]
MPIFRLDERLLFPPPELADSNGILAVGGDLSADRLLLGYSMGIFPWYSDGMPILWHSPDPRMVLTPDGLYVSRSLRKVMRKRRYEIRLDTAFETVIDACAEVPRPDQDGTWITSDMRESYIELHRLGYAHSAEAWDGDTLVGGLYGVSIGGAFFGESMFTRAPDASKIAFVTLVRQLAAWDIRLIDCQVHTDHLARFGAEEISRAVFLRALQRVLQRSTRRGRWRFDEPAEAASAILAP